MTRTSRFAALAALAAIGMLAGCSPTAPISSQPPAASAPSSAPSAPSAPTASATPDATPAPTAPAADPTVLFTITATVTANVNHAKADLVETVYRPVATTPDMAGDTSILNKQCEGWKKTFPHRDFITATFTATLEDGSPAWPKEVVPVGIDLGDQPAYSGDYEGFEAYCADATFKTIPGEAHGVLPVPAGDPAAGDYGWPQSTYGFAAAWDGPQNEIPKKLRIAIGNCTITLGAAASANAVAANWPGHPHTYGGWGCDYGPLE